MKKNLELAERIVMVLGVIAASLAIYGVYVDAFEKFPLGPMFAERGQGIREWRTSGVEYFWSPERMKGFYLIWYSLVEVYTLLCLYPLINATLLTPIFTRRGLRRRQKYEAECATRRSEHRGEEIIGDAQRKFGHIRHEVMLLSLRYSDGTPIALNRRQALDRYRIQLEDLYPTMCGEAWFDESTYQRILMQIATFLGEDLVPPASSPTRPVTRH